MDSTILLSQYPPPQHRIPSLQHHLSNPPHLTRLERAHTFSGGGIYQHMLTPAPSSFVRSSAPRSMMHLQSPNYYPYNPALQSDSPSTRSDSTSSGGTELTQSPDCQEYDVPVVPSQQYSSPEYAAATQRSLSWTSVDKMQQFTEYPSYQGPAMVPHYVPSQKDDSFSQHMAEFSNAASMRPFYDDQSNGGSGEVSLGSYGGMSGHGAQQYTAPSNHLTSAVDPPSVAYGFGGQATVPSQHMSASNASHNLQEASYVLASPHQLDYSSPSTLQYPSSSSTEGSPARFVNLAQVSPSPTISPELIFTDLPPAVPGSPGSQAYDPRVAGSSNGGSGRNSPASAVGYERGVVSGSVTSNGRYRARQGGEPSTKRRRRSSFTSSSEGSNGLAEAESGESEKEDEEDGDAEFEDPADDDDDDDDYVVRANLRPRVRRRSTRGANQEGGLTASATFTPALTGGTRRLAPPVPVPNLTKKSRGRRVPTAPVVISQNGVTKNSRSYMCRVNGCNKCFARGEHLKRHVRSIHTNEKPHKCPYPGCGKDFSRHDNLGQHMRVHKNYKPSVDGPN
ncbi:hypothetical protein BXZ70DRAFT_353377 [Cristinia sonorae]|uniref:C2H2-type domain-containing protein n=1 Tax=Cristinia sonorae TaxID=1940300 RepID=A0A8K0ULM2_9AGAR|nr:hypothetical protein BXZ70DRAFT_353377 [Cristinia sonorae]